MRESAAERELQVIDATCPLVTKVHNEAKRFAKEDYDTFTLPWRKLVGPIHPDDSDVERTRGTDLDGARQSKFSRGPD